MLVECPEVCRFVVDQHQVQDGPQAALDGSCLVAVC